ncbi:hypothetical protein Rctr85_096 [Virus Rctr85]|nr:hypothetical protein Rctr85_096 [Virus Rctr85]
MFKIGQRQVTAIIFVVLAVGASLIGGTPESLLELITQLIVPIGTIGAIFFHLLKAIQKRVNDPADPFTPGSLLKLFGSAEFVTALVFSALGLAPMVGIEIGDAQRDFIVTIVLNLVGLFVGVPVVQSFAARASGKDY